MVKKDKDSNADHFIPDECSKIFIWSKKNASQSRAQNLSEFDDDNLSRKFVLDSLDSSDALDEFDSDDDSSVDDMPNLVHHHDPHGDKNEYCSSDSDVLL